PDGGGLELAQRRGRIGKVGLEADDPPGRLERPNALGRAAGDAGRLGKGRWRGHPQRPLEGVHRGDGLRLELQASFEDTGPRDEIALAHASPRAYEAVD